MAVTTSGTSSAAINTGSTIYDAPRRGVGTCLKIADYPFAEWAKKRSRKTAIAEVTVEYEVRDILDLTTRVERRIQSGVGESSLCKVRRALSLIPNAQAEYVAFRRDGNVFTVNTAAGRPTLRASGGVLDFAFGRGGSLYVTRPNGNSCDVFSARGTRPLVRWRDIRAQVDRGRACATSRRTRTAGCCSRRTTSRSLPSRPGCSTCDRNLYAESDSATSQRLATPDEGSSPLPATTGRKAVAT